MRTDDAGPCNETPRATQHAETIRSDESYGGDPGEPPVDDCPICRALGLPKDDAEMTTVRSRIGNPPLRPLREIPEAELEGEIESLLELLLSNDIEVYFDRPLPDAEMYRFLSEELLEMRIEKETRTDSHAVFLYGLYHPDERTEAEMCAEDFCHGVLDGIDPMVIGTLAGVHDDDPPERRAAGQRLRSMVDTFRNVLRSVSSQHLNTRDISIDGDTARVTLDVSWGGTLSSGAPMRAGGTAVISLVRCPFGGWDVVDASLPGWDMITNAAS